ncbi:MAG TPA: histidine phosphatase family protein [Aeromicrobium sp.]|nr:histidine phosphatase family protein [Aeromicrobium sp.]
MSSRTIVHLMRHGEVHNPEGVLYGRLPDFHLSDLGRQMAQVVAESLVDHDVTHVVASPLERAQETAAPLADLKGLTVRTDDRVIEAGNSFEGKVFGKGAGSLLHPNNWWLVRNPLKPSWGEPYREIAARMRLAIDDARVAARGHEAVIVSHQLPVWIARRSYERASFAHDPRRRQCTLASLTSLTFQDDEFVAVVYSEPAGHLLPMAKAAFKGGK